MGIVKAEDKALVENSKFLAFLLGFSDISHIRIHRMW